jgi:hypothetical protein
MVHITAAGVDLAYGYAFTNSVSSDIATVTVANVSPYFSGI